MALAAKAASDDPEAAARDAAKWAQDNPEEAKAAAKKAAMAAAESKQGKAAMAAGKGKAMDLLGSSSGQMKSFGGGLMSQTKAMSKKYNKVGDNGGPDDEIDGASGGDVAAAATTKEAAKKAQWEARKAKMMAELGKMRKDRFGEAHCPAQTPYEFLRTQGERNRMMTVKHGVTGELIAESLDWYILPVGIQDAVIVLNLAKPKPTSDLKLEEEKRREADGFMNGDGWVDGVVRTGLAETVEMPLNRRTLIHFGPDSPEFKSLGKDKPGFFMSVKWSFDHVEVEIGTALEPPPPTFIYGLGECGTKRHPKPNLFLLLSSLTQP